MRKTCMVLFFIVILFLGGCASTDSPSEEGIIIEEIRLDSIKVKDQVIDLSWGVMLYRAYFEGEFLQVGQDLYFMDLGFSISLDDGNFTKLIIIDDDLGCVGYGDVKVGMDKGQIIDIWGTPSSDESDALVYTVGSDGRSTDTNIVSLVRFEIEDGGVSTIIIGKL